MIAILNIATLLKNDEKISLGCDIKASKTIL